MNYNSELSSSNVATGTSLLHVATTTGRGGRSKFASKNLALWSHNLLLSRSFLSLFHPHSAATRPMEGGTRSSLPSIPVAQLVGHDGPILDVVFTSEFTLFSHCPTNLY